ncbi:MAG: GyrI-like domain-containing protein [Desulfotomaculaceae bacterium]|nr:GyrI-like domain-containing protein [Desulfotomaculaceae bacterium]
MPIDYKKTEKDLYLPKNMPSVIDVPQMTFITVDGKGDPNTSAEYTAAVELLYGLSYAIKMGNKSVLQYIVPPLEGLWSVDDDFRGGGGAISDKGKFKWTMMIRQPDFVTADTFEAAKATLAKKKPNLDTSKAKLEIITEGLCVQVMHIGSYDDESATVAALDRFAIENGYAIDIDDTRRHHEIYISDPRRIAPEKLKTVLRHPIRRERGEE